MTKAQTGVALGMAGGLVLTMLGLAGGAAWTSSLSAPAPLSERFTLLALSVLAPIAALVFSIARLARHRFFTPQDIDGNGLTVGTERSRLLQALLQNTLEQLALALPVYAACLVLMPDDKLGVVPAASMMFLLGRILFFWGYERGAPGRALGFALTFYPSVLLWVGAVVVGLRILVD